jgi:hypothetical protein
MREVHGKVITSNNSSLSGGGIKGGVKQAGCKHNAE